MDVPDEDSLERAPRLEHYRNSLNLPIPRPTLTDLHDACPEELNDEEKKVFDEEFGFDFPIEERGKTPVPEASEVEEVEERGLGWFRGVFVPCVLNILGLMIYIRVGWVAGHAGIVMGTALILLSTAICVVTALSLSAICTNGDARGGPYFLISRSLGPEFGGSIGVIFAVANAMGAAMYATGFSETVQELLSRNGHEIADGGVNDVRIISAITLLLLFLLIQSGFKLNSWGQILLLTILFVSMGSFFIGALLPSSILAKERGITGVSSETFVDNLGPLWKTGSGMTVFAVFFPAATGIMAGTHSAEELEHPQSAIPRGTLAAIGTTAFAYILTLWMTGATVRRNLSLDASGNYTHIDLLHYYPVVQAESIWPPIVVVGTLAASLSSTLASIVYASRVLQVLSRDKLFPGIHHFATGWRNHVQPQKAQLFITGIAILVSLVGILNSIASVISNFFLAFYALVNYACFNASFADSPGFRPCFKYYNLWVSLCGAMVCVVIMFLINWISAMITWAVLFALYSYIHRRNTGLNWGSSAQASIYRSALQSVLKLAHTEDHVKNYRPQILVLTGNPVSRPSLVDYMSNITRDNSLLICGHILVASSPVRFHAYLPALTKRVESWLWSRKVKAFYCPVAAASFEDGATQLIQLAGIGKLRPNILFLGFKHDWQRSTFAEIDAFINVIHHAFDQNFGVGLVRLPDGLHLSGQITLLDRNASERRSQRSQRTPTPTDEPTEPKRRLREHYKDQDLEPESLMNDMETAKMELQASINQFQLKTRGTIDVWWLYDDGALSLEMQSCFMEPASLALGLSLLLPHLLAGKGSYLDGSRMRVFTIASSQRQLEQEQRSMAALLTKFRIDFSDVFVLSSVTRVPETASLNDYKALVSGIKKSGTDAEDSCFTNAHLSAQRERTFRHLRVRELLLEHSMEADMIFMTLPVPRKGILSPLLFMIWLELLTKDMPPVTLLRGNQQSVLTFYS